MADHQTPEDLATASWASPPGLGRCLAIGSAIGVALSFLLITALSVLGGIEGGAAVGFGAFVALWGGLGFGSMMGGVAYAMGLEGSSDEDEPSASVPTGATEPGLVEATTVEAMGDRRVA